MERIVISSRKRKAQEREEWRKIVEEAQAHKKAAESAKKKNYNYHESYICL